MELPCNGNLSFNIKTFVTYINYTLLVALITKQCKKLKCSKTHQVKLSPGNVYFLIEMSFKC